jgi:quinol-cytochrome oxidoreductase complex cytochrome b subunit
MFGHIPRVSNPTGVEGRELMNTVPFHPYYTAKDGFPGLASPDSVHGDGKFPPNFLGHADNYIEQSAGDACGTLCPNGTSGRSTPSRAHHF